MIPAELTLTVRVEAPRAMTITLKKVSPYETVAEILQEVLRRLGLPTGEPGWCLSHQGSVLLPTADLCSCLPLSQEPIELLLQQEAAELPSLDFEESISLKCLPVEALSLEEEACNSDFDLCLADSTEEVEEEPMVVQASQTAASDHRRAASHGTGAKKTVKRRATVRYYSRMNPERVYPLLVILTREMVEKVAKKGVAQRTSGPFTVDVESPVEIEPVLPGCDCHPPKVVTRLGAADLTVTFRVVPRVLGKVDGATVSIRQDHASLAEVGLEVRVVQRTWVALSGVLTFLLPGLSAALKHFGLDFESQRDAGFSLYLSVARLVFDRVSPLGLTAAGGALTGLLWWLARPRIRDVFWDIEKIGPGEQLRRITAAAEANPEQAAQDLMELLQTFPDHQPAWVYYAEWHYRRKSYEAALKGYGQAFALATGKANDYYRASLCASRLGLNKRALGILQDAERLLPAGQMTGAMLFNMGCYHVRLGDGDAAMTRLKRAVQAGYRKLDSYVKDPDLAPLRSRGDFQQLLAELRRTAPKGN